jgi:hypothetical protein
MVEILTYPGSGKMLFSERGGGRYLVRFICMCMHMLPNLLQRTKHKYVVLYGTLRLTGCSV